VAPYPSLDCFGDDAEFHHVGIAVRSIEETYRKVEDPIQKVRVAFLELNGLTVELVEPLEDRSPVSEILQKGQSIYHVCFQVPNIQRAIDQARGCGFHCIRQPAPAAAFEERKIAWLFSNVYGLVEVLEK